MDSKFDEIINPSWMNQIHKVTEETSFISEMIKPYEDIMAHQRLITGQYANINSSFISKEIEKMSSLALYKSSILDSVRDSAVQLREQLSSQSIENLMATSRLVTESIQKSAQLNSAILSAQKAAEQSALMRHQAVLDSTSRYTQLASISALKELRNVPFFIPSHEMFDRVLEITQVRESISERDAARDLELAGELSISVDFNELSEKAKGFLLYFYHNYFLPILLSILASQMTKDIELAQLQLSCCKKKQEVKAVTKGNAALNFNRSSLTGYRVTIAESVNFRLQPSMKSKVIGQLPVGTLLEVLNSDNRSWIHVEVEVSGELVQGWVSRRYTVYFN